MKIKKALCSPIPRAIAMVEYISYQAQYSCQCRRLQLVFFKLCSSAALKLVRMHYRHCCTKQNLQTQGIYWYSPTICIFSFSLNHFFICKTNISIALRGHNCNTEVEHLIDLSINLTYKLFIQLYKVFSFDLTKQSDIKVQYVMNIILVHIIFYAPLPHFLLNSQTAFINIGGKTFDP